MPVKEIGVPAIAVVPVTVAALSPMPCALVVSSLTLLPAGGASLHFWRLRQPGAVRAVGTIEEEIVGARIGSGLRKSARQTGPWEFSRFLATSHPTYSRRSESG
jgi:hypothetical protein